MGIDVVGRESKGLKKSDRPAVSYTTEPTIVAGPRTVPNLVLTGDDSLSGSYVYYNDAQGDTKKYRLAKGQGLSLKQAFGPAALGAPAPLFDLAAGRLDRLGLLPVGQIRGSNHKEERVRLGQSRPGGGTGTGGAAYGFKSILG